MQRSRRDIKTSELLIKKLDQSTEPHHLAPKAVLLSSKPGFPCSHLSEELIGYQGVWRDVHLGAGGADVLV